MKLLFIHRWVGVHHGGTETHIRNLMRRLRSCGHQITLVTREGPELSNFGDSVEVVRVGKSWGESDYSYERVLPLYFYTGLFVLKLLLTVVGMVVVRRRRFDVVSVHFATEAMVARLIRFLFGIPFVFVLEGYTDLEASLAKTADAAIAISQTDVESVFKSQDFRPVLLPVGRDERFNQNVDGSAVRQRYLEGADKLIICVGRIEPRKDHPTLLKAARILKDKGFKYHWLVVGEGIRRPEVGWSVKEFGLDSEVKMLGDLAEEDLPLYYRAADLFVLPTLYEGFGIVFIEAMACGLPVVSTKVGAVPEVVDGAGFLVAPGDPEALAEKIVSILSDSALYHSLQQRALERANFYSWGRLIPEYEKVYLSVTDHARSLHR